MKQLVHVLNKQLGFNVPNHLLDHNAVFVVQTGRVNAAVFSVQSFATNGLEQRELAHLNLVNATQQYLDLIEQDQVLHEKGLHAFKELASKSVLVSLFTGQTRPGQEAQSPSLRRFVLESLRTLNDLDELEQATRWACIHALAFLVKSEAMYYGIKTPGTAYDLFRNPVLSKAAQQVVFYENAGNILQAIEELESHPDLQDLRERIEEIVRPSIQKQQQSGFDVLPFAQLLGPRLQTSAQTKVPPLLQAHQLALLAHHASKGVLDIPCLQEVVTLAAESADLNALPELDAFEEIEKDPLKAQCAHLLVRTFLDQLAPAKLLNDSKHKPSQEFTMYEALFVTKHRGESQSESDKPLLSLQTISQAIELLSSAVKAHGNEVKAPDLPPEHEAHRLKFFPYRAAMQAVVSLHRHLQDCYQKAFTLRIHGRIGLLGAQLNKLCQAIEKTGCPDFCACVGLQLEQEAIKAQKSLEQGMGAYLPILATQQALEAYRAQIGHIGQQTDPQSPSLVQSSKDAGNRNVIAALTSARDRISDLLAQASSTSKTGHSSAKDLDNNGQRSPSP